MATKDLTMTGNVTYPPLNGTRTLLLGARRITGAELNLAGIPGTDSFRIAKLGDKQKVWAVETTVIDADANAITLEIGYESESSDPNAFETDAALNAQGTTFSQIALKTMCGNTNFLTITPSAAIEDATTFVVSWYVIDEQKTITDTLTDVI